MTLSGGGQAQFTMGQIAVRIPDVTTHTALTGPVRNGWRLLHNENPARVQVDGGEKKIK